MFVGVKVNVGVEVLVDVGPGVNVAVAVGVLVNVGDGPGVFVCVGVGVFVGVFVGRGPEEEKWNASTSLATNPQALPSK